MKKLLTARSLCFPTFAFCLLASVLCRPAFAQGTAFTYQGRLNDGANPANGIYDLRFAIYDAPTAGTQQGISITNSAMAVSNGLFTATLNFGNQFPGANRWLEIGVRTNGSSSFVTLNPRQALTPAPYAITAGNVISGGLASGTYGNAVAFSNNANQFSGSGSGLTGLSASQLASGTVPDARLAANLARTNQVWLLSGNAGTIPGQFLGTTDNQPLDIRVSNVRALHLSLTTDATGTYSNAPNIVNGSPLNSAQTTNVGITIAGGGGTSIPDGVIYPNRAYGNFGTIAGGIGNTVDGNFATVAGGYVNYAVDTSTVGGGRYNRANGAMANVGGGAFNDAFGNPATIGGGYANYASGIYSTVAGGGYNVSTNDQSTVGGGRYNTAGGVSTTIAGGYLNITLQNDSVVSGGYQNKSTGWACVVGGGWFNNASNIWDVVDGGYNNIAGGGNSVVAGGSNNVTAAALTVIGGGGMNLIKGFTDQSTIGGGSFNAISANAPTDNALGSTIGGGLNNQIHVCLAAVIGGGENNVIQGYADRSTISGGGNNLIVGSYYNLVYGTIGGGYRNVIQTNTSYATIAGGLLNTNNAPFYGTVGGGVGNAASGSSSTIAGGFQNRTTGIASSVPGGAYNTASGDYSFAAGQRAKADDVGSFVWADDSPFDSHSFTSNQFCVRCTGGAKFVTAIDGSGGQTAGVRLQSGDTAWSSISDRNAKKNFQPVNGEAVLQKLTATPVQSWNYKWEADTDTPHLGPMAQDFKAAFYPGRDDKTISTLEFDGVELAAIQGLNQKLQQKETEITELKQRLDALEKIIRNLKPN